MENVDVLLAVLILCIIFWLAMFSSGNRHEPPPESDAKAGFSVGYQIYPYAIGMGQFPLAHRESCNN